MVTANLSNGVLNGIEVEVVRRLYEQEQLGVRETAERLGIAPWRLYRFMRQRNIPRRRGTEQNYVTYKTKGQFHLKASLSPLEEQLRVAGTMLYLAEGVKARGTVDFANSDPRLIKLFVRFLRLICGVVDTRLRVLLYAYANQDIEALKTFWSSITRIPLHQFIKPYVRPITPNMTGRKMPWGLVHIRYNDRRLLEVVLKWGEQFSQFWAGT